MVVIDIPKITISWVKFQAEVNPAMLNYYYPYTGMKLNWKSTFDIELHEYTFEFENIDDKTEFILRWL